jgi:hypothetical protein
LAQPSPPGASIDEEDVIHQYVSPTKSLLTSHLFQSPPYKFEFEFGVKEEHAHRGGFAGSEV